MKSAIAVFVIFAGFVSSSAVLAKAEPLVFGKENACDPCKKARERTPQEKCKEARGKWVNDMCVKTRIVKRRVIRRVETPVPPMDFELQCYRRGGEWRDGLCYGKNVAQAPVAAPSPGKTVIVNQEQKVVVKTTPPSAPKSVPPPLKKAKKRQWWWIGIGAWAAGTWAGEKDFYAGIHGILAFAINYRFRVAGNIGVGFGPWQENGRMNLWIDGIFAVRAYKQLFVNFGLETAWGGFDGLSVHRRTLALSAGPEYWFGNDASISLRFLIGLNDNVTDCRVNSGQVAGGNLFTAAVYF